MRISYIIAVVVCALCNHSNASGIIEISDYHADDARVGANQSWLALQNLKNESRLIEVRPKFKRIEDQITGEGIRVIVNISNARILLADRSLRPGPVESLPLIGLPITGKQQAIDFKGRQYTLSNREGRLFLTFQGKSQHLFDYSEESETNAKLEWIGDLDRDGKLDLIVDASNHYNVHELRLYLSGKASSRSLVKQVATRRSVGC